MIEKLVTGSLKLGVLCIGLAAFGAPALAFDDGLGGRTGTNPLPDCSKESSCYMCCFIDYLGNGDDEARFKQCMSQNSCQDIVGGDEANSAVEPEGFDVPWSTVGSAASVDESDLDEFYTSRGLLGVRDPGTIVGRWQFFDPRFEGLRCPVLRVRYSDNGPDSKVYVRMIRWDTQGRSWTVGDFLSDRHVQTGWQTQKTRFEHDFDFTTGAYFLEAWVSKYGSAGVSEIGIIQVEPARCIP